MSDEKENKKKISIVTWIVVIIGFLFIFNIYLSKPSGIKVDERIIEPSDCSDGILWPPSVACLNPSNIGWNKKIKFEYENNEQNKNVVTPQIKIIEGLYSHYDIDLQAKLLNDGNVLLYNPGQSFLFESKNNKINFIPPLMKKSPFSSLDTDHYYNSCYKKGMEVIGEEDFFLDEEGIFDLGKNKYFVFPFLVFDLRKRSFSLISKGWIKKYKQFANNRKYEHKNIKYLNTFSNNTFLYGKPLLSG